MLSPAERVRVKYHLGYPLLSAVPALNAGIPVSTPMLSIVDLAMNSLLPDGEPMVREQIARCDQLDQAIIDAQIRMQVSKVDGVEMREHETDLLDVEYARQAARPSDILHAPFYPFSTRYRSMQQLGLGGRVQTGMIGVA